jgi:AcrR family transcriptional regulator
MDPRTDPIPATDLKQRRGYHHGNLREALVEAARRLIAERGPLGFTLIEAARAANVSPAAPYRHFRDRHALLVEVARRGFAAFSARLRGAAESGGPPREAFSRLGAAYLAFAREEPGYYGAMFMAGIDMAKDCPPPPSDGNAFDALVGSMSRMFESLGRKPDMDPRLLALQVWSMSHGVATLSAARALPENVPGVTPETILDKAVTALIRGALAPAADPVTKP